MITNNIFKEAAWVVNFSIILEILGMSYCYEVVFTLKKSEYITFKVLILIP